VKLVMLKKEVVVFVFNFFGSYFMDYYSRALHGIKNTDLSNDL